MPLSLLSLPFLFFFLFLFHSSSSLLTDNDRHPGYRPYYLTYIHTHLQRDSRMRRKNSTGASGNGFSVFGARINIPIKLPPPLNLSAKEKDLSFREGLLKKRRSDPSSFIRESFHSGKHQVLLLRLLQDNHDASSLVYSPEDCMVQRLARAASPVTATASSTDAQTVLLVYWLSRCDPRTLTACANFALSESAAGSITSALYQNNYLAKSMLGGSRYSYGMRLLQVLNRIKSESLSKVPSSREQWGA